MDKATIELVKKLKSKNENDLANLLVNCRSAIEESDQYGSFWNKFLSSFIIYTPKEKYLKLSKLTREDIEKILQSVLDIYPKSEDLEIGFLNFKLLSNESSLIENKKLACSWIERAKNKLEEGVRLIDKLQYAEAISSFQECIELSLKVVSILSLDKYRKDHKFDEKEFKEVLDCIPDSIENLEFHKLYLYSRFWSNFYTIAKYGLENFGIGAEKLFEEKEAKLAKEHADKCYSAATQLKDYLENPW